MADASPGEIDLSACDREPIHVPGAIQPHGLLLALDDEQRVRRVAGPIGQLLGCEDPPLHRRIDELFADFAPLDAGLASVTSPVAEHLGRIDSTGRTYDVFAHPSGDEVIVELEPVPERRVSAAEALGDIVGLSEAIARAPDLVAACAETATWIRRVIGYDRVMIYRFLDDDSGEVIAEDLAEGMEPLLHHRYPASDIPQQARALYLRNPVRLIPNVDYQPAPIIGGDTPLDLSGAVLRSVSPIHIQYLKNMGVGASASVSLIQDGTLWGLIACHHASAREIPHEQRQMCRQAGLLLDGSISEREGENSQREILRLTQRREDVVGAVASSQSVANGLATHIDLLRRSIPADGVALLVEEQLVRSGVTPPEPALRQLGDWLLARDGQTAFSSSCLSKQFPPAADWPDSGSGVLARIVSRAPLVAIMWFRAEQVQTVNWAGNPHKPVEQGAGPQLLTPRTSFELWKETVSGCSTRWRRNEEVAADRLAAAVAEIGQQKALVELNRQLRGAVSAKDELLTEKDLLMREVHHRVQNNLQLVTAMLQLQEGDLTDDLARAQLELARQRIAAVSMFHRRLWRADKVGALNLEAFFSELAEGLEQTWPDEWKGRLTLDIAPVPVPSREGLFLALIVTELLTNSVKHAYAGAAGPLSLTVRERGDGAMLITVADRGIGMGGDDRPGSFGSRLVQRLAGQMNAELKFEPGNPGTIITLTVPRLAADERLDLPIDGCL